MFLNVKHATLIRQTSRKKCSYLMIHLNALGLMLQQTFLVLTTKSGSSSLVRLFELNQLSSTNSSSVIKSLNNQFARHGIPDTLYSDNGPQFACRQFKEFASAWHFDHPTSSPHYPQSNGKIENAVKIAKKLLTKAKASGQDPYLAIFD